MTDARDRLPSLEPAVTACPACGGSRSEALHAIGDRWMEGPGVFHYLSCLDCGAAYLADPPGEADWPLYYPHGYIRRGTAPRNLRARLRRRDLAPRVELVRRQPGGRRVLDVGCATGEFLDAMRRHGWTVAGVEPTPWAAHEATSRGLPVWPSTLADARLPRGAFDVATMWDVIEHLGDPGADLRAVSQALRPGGRLVLTTPVHDGWEARAFGTRWPGWDAPRHLVVFSRQALHRLLAATGYRVLEERWISESYLISAMHVSLLARERLPRRVADAVWTAAHLRPLRLAAAPSFRWLDETLGGCWLTVVAEWDGGDSIGERRR
jgi:2-polyprenyl-3-methyl-5-hydroxy-6-metoxy-1,4-benzoquinol methylase